MYAGGAGAYLTKCHAAAPQPRAEFPSGQHLNRLHKVVAGDDLMWFSSDNTLDCRRIYSTGMMEARYAG